MTSARSIGETGDRRRKPHRRHDSAARRSVEDLQKRGRIVIRFQSRHRPTFIIPVFGSKHTHNPYRLNH
jgi:hypothetical protein